LFEENVMTTDAPLSARDRLLASADQLFYSEGVHTVGVDRIIEHAGVAKATLYNTFGSKDELVRAYLRSRHANIADRIISALQRYRTPRTRLLGVFDALGEIFADPDFHGCAFVSATSEAHDASVAEAADEHRLWVRSLLTELAEQAGARSPKTLAHQLHLLVDGASVSASMDPNGRAADTARATATVLLDAALSDTS
jgi:AcrR family transcriptional regulator